MIRRAINIASALLLVLCVGEYFQSFWRKDFLTRTGSGGLFELTVSRGRIAFTWDGEPIGNYGNYWDHGTYAPALPIELAHPYAVPPGPLNFDRYGFDFETHRYGQRRDHTLAIPLWFPTIVAAIPVAFAVAGAFRHRRRVVLKLCLRCGYDLRASTDRCPECGTTIPKEARA